MCWLGLTRQFSGLSEIRDVREVLTISAAMDAVNKKQTGQALHILSQRILAIPNAKAKGGAWDKAASIELLPSGSTLAPVSMLALTQG